MSANFEGYKYDHGENGGERVLHLPRLANSK
jgi:hypothetical protein